MIKIVTALFCLTCYAQQLLEHRHVFIERKLAATEINDTVINSTVAAPNITLLNKTQPYNATAAKIA